MKCVINKFLLTLILIAIIGACKPTEGSQAQDKQQLLANNCQYKEAASNLSVESPFIADIGHIKVEEALKKCPELQKAYSSSITYAGIRIEMPNSYLLSLSNGGMVVFQFDAESNVLQNVLLGELKQSFESAKEDLKKHYPISPQYTEAEFEAYYSYDNTSFENHHKRLEEFQDEQINFKQGSVLITLGKDTQNEGNIVIFYENTNYLPVLKEKAQFPSNIIQLLEKQHITMDVGRITVEEALKKYPKLQKRSNTSIFYGNKKIAMPNSYLFFLSDGGRVIFQFDEESNVLQNVAIIELKQSFKSAKADLKKYYPIYPQYTLAEFEANYLDNKLTFENHRQYLEEHKDKLTFFKQGSILILLSKYTNDENHIAVIYQNSDYLPVLKEKAAAIK